MLLMPQDRPREGSLTTKKRFFVTEFTLSDNNEILHFAQNDTSEGFRKTKNEVFRMTRVKGSEWQKTKCSEMTFRRLFVS